MDERLIHYSAHPIAALDDAFSYATRPTGFHKPQGLWVSVGEEWREWCEAEGFSLESLAHEHRVVLHPHANILRLRSAEDLDAFTKQYETPMLPERPREKWNLAIDWAAVRVAHQGVVIAPYIYARRYDLSWYYGWDCASGCIWDLAAIAAIDPIANSESAPKKQENVDG